MVLSVKCYGLMPYGKILCVDLHTIREQPMGCFRPRFGLKAVHSVGHMDVGWCLASSEMRVRALHVSQQPFESQTPFT